jgi:hypothetical protein
VSATKDSYEGGKAAAKAVNMPPESVGLEELRAATITAFKARVLCSLRPPVCLRRHSFH